MWDAPSAGGFAAHPPGQENARSRGFAASRAFPDELQRTKHFSASSPKNPFAPLLARSEMLGVIPSGASCARNWCGVQQVTPDKLSREFETKLSPWPVCVCTLGISDVKSWLCTCSWPPPTAQTPASPRAAHTVGLQRIVELLAWKRPLKSEGPTINPAPLERPQEPHPHPFLNPPRDGDSPPPWAVVSRT